MKMIPLTKGMYAKVDDDDYELLSRFNWCAGKGSKNKTYYALRGVKEDGVARRIYMHRIIAQAGPGEIVDHKNHDTLDNRKENLRLGSQALNQLNRLPIPGGQSAYKGVHYHAPSAKWMAVFNRKLIGYFNKETEAAIAYNIAAKIGGGDWACLNIIPGLTEKEMLTLPPIKRKQKKYRYRGVTRRGFGQWLAYIQIGNTRHNLGTYNNETLAAEAFNRACDEHGCPERKNAIYYPPPKYA